MTPARRYEELLRNIPERLRENTSAKKPQGLTELEVQASWFAGDFGTEFTAGNGDKIAVVQFGEWNREAGPDFAQAAISINGGEAVRGSIEIDMDAQDWERHGHATNPDYNSVVLHVCLFESGRQFFTRTEQHREVPRVRIDPGKITEPANPLPLAKAGRCSSPLRDMPPDTLREILTAAAQYRLGRKSARLARAGALHGQDEALYQALATTLGYKNNKLPFTILAQRLPLAFLSRCVDDACAILFGTAGILREADFTKLELDTRSWLRNVWDRWWKLRDQFSRTVLPADAWKLSATRPVNHPQRRLAALGLLVRHWKRIRAFAKDGNIEGIREFFEDLRDEYWDHHYTLTSKRTAQRMALIGPTRINDMLANVFYPLVISTHPERWKDYAKLPAPMASSRVKIAATRLISDATTSKAVLKNAVYQQGLLQIYEDFCMQDNSDCAQCLFPKQIAQWQ